jgi:hypothetical protein
MKYIYIDSGRGSVYPSGFAIDEKGQIIEVGKSDEKGRAFPIVKTAAVLPGNLFSIWTQDTFNKFQQQTKQTTTMQRNNELSFINTQNVGGGTEIGRVENPFNGGQELITVKLVLDYSSPLAPGDNLSTIVGDGSDVIRSVNPTYDNTATAVANGMKVDGTYGSKTLDVLKALSQNLMRFHNLQAEASAASYWNNKSFAVKQLSANGQGSASGINVDFSLYQDGSQFNDKIRNIPNFRFTISNFTALQILVNNGESVTYTFKFQSAGTAGIMELASKF